MRKTSRHTFVPAASSVEPVRETTGDLSGTASLALTILITQLRISIISSMNLWQFSRFALLACLTAFPNLHASDRVRIISTPERGQVPDAEASKDGVLHLAYVAGKDAWYVKSSDEGKTFTTPLQIGR